MPTKTWQITFFSLPQKYENFFKGIFNHRVVGVTKAVTVLIHPNRLNSQAAVFNYEVLKLDQFLAPTDPLHALLFLR